MKPQITCFMYSSLDGRIDCAMTEKIDPEAAAYYEVLKEFDEVTMFNGKTTCDMHYADEDKYFFKDVKEDKCAGRQFYKAVESKKYHVCFDTNGTLLFSKTSGVIEGRPVLVVTSEKANQQYLEILKAEKISYICTGKDSIDIEDAMETLSKEFGVEKAVLTGGGHLNGAFLDKGLIDDIYMMYGPGIDGRAGWAAAFDGREQDRNPVVLKLTEVKQMQCDTVLLKYKTAR